MRTPDRNDRLAFQLVFAFMEVADDTMLVIRRRPGGYLCLKQIYGGSLAHGTDVWSTLVPLPRAMAAKPLRIKLFNR